MPFYVVSSNHFITFFGFYTFRLHRLIAYQQERACRYLIVKTNCKNGSCFHINCIRTNGAEIIFKLIIMLPNTAVGSIYCTRPVVHLIFADGGRYSFLQGKGRECWYFGW